MLTLPPTIGHLWPGRGAFDLMMMAASGLAAWVREELSDGAYSPRGADTPAVGLISQTHCASHGEKNIDQDSFIPTADIW